MSDEITAIEKLEKVQAAISDLEGLPIAFGVCKSLNETSKMLDGYIRIEKSRAAALTEGEDS